MPSTLLMIGDSVTQTGKFEDAERIGTGYVAGVRARLRVAEVPLQIVNRGIAGNRVRDLEARWKADCLDLQPAAVSIAIGINDTLRRYDRQDPTPVAAFRRGYRRLLEALPEGTAVILVEPFLVPVREEQNAWREDLDPKLAVVRELADEFGAAVVPADRRLMEAAAARGAAAIAADGVHPTPFGHGVLAEIWWESSLAALEVATSTRC